MFSTCGRRPAPTRQKGTDGISLPARDQDGTPADPPTLLSVVPTWGPGDVIPLGAGLSLRVVEVRPGGADENGVLVVEPV